MIAAFARAHPCIFTALCALALVLVFVVSGRGK